MKRTKLNDYITWVRCAWCKDDHRVAVFDNCGYKRLVIACKDDSLLKRVGRAFWLPSHNLHILYRERDFSRWFALIKEGLTTENWDESDIMLTRRQWEKLLASFEGGKGEKNAK